MHANSVDPDQTPRSAASDLGVHCLQMPICPNTKRYYGKNDFQLPFCEQKTSKCNNAGSSIIMSNSPCLLPE